MIPNEHRQDVPAGTEVTLVNHPKDAQSVLVEGLSGLAITNNLVKVNFFEQFMDIEKPGQLFGRYNLVLNVPVPQFISLVDVLKRVADELAEQNPPPVS